MKKKVLISGGSGFIGSFIVKQLIRKKYFVINVDKLSYASQKSVIKHKNVFQFRPPMEGLRDLKGTG